MSSDEKPPAQPKRAAHLIARAGLASRREAETWILAGRVRFEGVVMQDLARRFASTENLMLDGKPIPEASPTQLWLYHKPLARLVARPMTRSGQRGELTIYHDLPRNLRHLLPVGRLDRMSRGLLLLTNDGQLARHLELPVSGYQRTYQVALRVKRKLEESDFEPLRAGLNIEGEQFRPAKINLVAQKPGRVWVQMVLMEGRKREIRRMMEVLGHEVEDLLRIGFGPFRLGGLKAGECRPMVSRLVFNALPEFFKGKRK